MKLMLQRERSDVKENTIAQCIIPRIFQWGVVVLFFATIAASVAAFTLEDRFRWSMNVGLVAIILELASCIAIGKGWAFYYPDRIRRRRDQQTLQISCLNGEESQSQENVVENVALVFFNEEKKEYQFRSIFDFVLARSGLAVLFRYTPEQPSGLEGLALLGGYVGYLAQQSVAKDQEARNIAMSKAAEAERKKEFGKSLSESVRANVKSFVLPLADIIGLKEKKRDESGAVVFEILAGFEAYCFAASQEVLNRLEDWLRASRAAGRLSPLDPPPFSHRALDEWAKKSTCPIPNDVLQEFAAIEHRPTLHLSLAKCIDLSVCKVLRQNMGRHPVAVAVRKLAVERHFDSKMTWTGLGAIFSPIGSMVLFLTAVSTHGKNFGPLPFYLVLLFLLGIISSIVGLCLLADGLTGAAHAQTEQHAGIGDGAAESA